MVVDDEAIMPVEGVILVGNAEAIIPVVVFISVRLSGGSFFVV
jgi:hypothetical protein